MHAHQHKCYFNSLIKGTNHPRQPQTFPPLQGQSCCLAAGVEKGEICSEVEQDCH